MKIMIAILFICAGVSILIIAQVLKKFETRLKTLEENHNGK